MPTVEWNRSWADNLRSFERGELKGRFYGDQWGVPEANPMLRAVVDRHLRPFVGPGKTALEIGSGGGRWTRYLLDCEQVICVELNAEMFGALAERFPEATNLRFVTTGGTDLPGVEPDSVDFVFSFGVLVHCDRPIIEGYLRSLHPVMRVGARAHLQFSDKRKPRAAGNPDFADTVPADVAEAAEATGFRVDLLDETTLDHSAVIQIVRA